MRSLGSNSAAGRLGDAACRWRLGGLGFVNFAMDQFGVQKPALKALARTPVLPSARPSAARGPRDTTPHEWLGATVRNIADEGEMSAYGLPGVVGILVLAVPAESALARGGLRHGDVILGLDGHSAADVAALLHAAPTLAAFQTLTLRVSRTQKEISVTVSP